MSEAQKKTSIGGQAVIEGVMMRGPGRSALAVRLPDGRIDVETWENKNGRAWYKKTPFIRGIFNLIDSLREGYRCLMKSAGKSGMEEEEPSRFDRWLEKTFGDKLMKVLSGVSMVLGVVLALGLFIIAPTYAVKGLSLLVPLGGWATVIEGVLKIAIFIAYMALVSRMPDIRRVFEYHGAEHKTIACYEAGLELTPENAARQTRFHPRCGTSFIFLVLIISILVNSFLSWESVLLRVVCKVLLLPVVMGITYEIIKLAGRYTNVCTRALSAPGLWLQRLTTREPDFAQLEVAIASVKPVLPREDEDDRW